jgi:hypothetical protein
LRIPRATRRRQAIDLGVQLVPLGVALSGLGVPGRRPARQTSDLVISAGKLLVRGAQQPSQGELALVSRREALGQVL